MNTLLLVLLLRFGKSNDSFDLGSWIQSNLNEY